MHHRRGDQVALEVLHHHIEGKHRQGLPGTLQQRHGHREQSAQGGAHVGNDVEHTRQHGVRSHQTHAQQRESDRRQRSHAQGADQHSTHPGAEGLTALEQHLACPAPIEGGNQQQQGFPVGGGLGSHHQGHRHHEQGLEQHGAHVADQSHQAEGPVTHSTGDGWTGSHRTSQILEPAQAAIATAVQHAGDAFKALMEQGEQFSPGFRQFLHQFTELGHEGGHNCGGSHR